MKTVPLKNKGDRKMDNIKRWYLEVFQDDDLGSEISDNATFEDLKYAIENGNDIYNVIQVEDSVIRERLFRELAYIENVCYDDIYDSWLNSIQ